MAESQVPTNGRFVWYELMTKDKGKALDFYKNMFGWNSHEEDMGELGKYPMVGVGESWQAGMITPPQENIPSQWIAYVTVDDVDATVKKAEELGGKVVSPPMDIPNVGRMAGLLDPQGATILPFKFAADAPPEPEAPQPAGTFCWNELLTSDPKAAQGFYQEVFGWDVETANMGEMGTYWMYKRGSKEEAGMMAMPEQAEAPPHWLPYISVDDVDAAAEKCEKLGGKVYCKPTDIPSIGRFAVMSDPEGATFATFKSAK